MHTRHLAWQVNEIAKVAFRGPDAVDATVLFAVRLSTALDDYQRRVEDFNDVACTLFRLQPQGRTGRILKQPTYQAPLWLPRAFFRVRALNLGLAEYESRKPSELTLTRSTGFLPIIWTPCYGASLRF